MFIRRFGSRTIILPLLLTSLACLFATSCSSNESKAKKAVAEYLKNQGTTDLTVDLFYMDPKSPDKAYISVSVTHSYSSSSGKLQHEYLGFILARTGNGWQVERNTSYTKEEQKAAIYVAGGK